MRRNAPPYQSPALDEILAAKLRDMNVVMRGCENALRDIAAVGALVDMSGNMLDSDLEIIGIACGELAKAGVLIHPAPRLQVYNLLPPVGSDFLYAADDSGTVQPADLIVACLVFSGSARLSDFDLLRPEQKQGYEDFSRIYRDYELFPGRDRLTGVSPLQDFSIVNVWEQAAYNTGARYIATFGGPGDEIGTRHFIDRARFKALITTEEDYQDSIIGCNSGSFGFLVREGVTPPRFTLKN